MTTFSDLFSFNQSVISVVTGCLVFFFVIETYRFLKHQKNIRTIPIRIHVNGSRGKSSTTRLIGAVLRETGKITVTKTTGTAPRFIMPDGDEIPIFRPGKPNIIEQLKVVNRAVMLKAEAIVMECMAVTPEYIDTLEKKIICSTLGVMTNVREDHLDVMGPTVQHAARYMAASFTRNGIIYTAENIWFSTLKEEATKRNSLLQFVSGDSITDQEMEGFSYIEHKENVAIALGIAYHFGLSRERAFRAMYRALPDPGVLRETIVTHESGTIYFFNALAANDPDSSLLIWKNALSKRQGKTVVVLILREDRQQRTESFAKALGSTIFADIYLIAGPRNVFVKNSLFKKGVKPDNVICMDKPTAKELLEQLCLVAENSNCVASAMGNIVGLGDAFIRELNIREPYIRDLSVKELYVKEKQGVLA